MSAAPSLPPDYHESVPPPRKPRTWVRVAEWVGIGILILIALVIAAVLVLPRIPQVRQYVLAKAQRRITTALGTRVQVRDFALHLSLATPELDLYNVTIYGALPHPTPPLLVADHIHAGATIVSLLRRKWYLKNVRVDHPVIRIVVDRDGEDNLPQTKSSNNRQNQTSVFDLGIRHAVLERGEVYYNNRKSALDADLHDLEFSSTFDTARRQYAGTLSYRDGHLQFGNYEPVPHDLNAQFTANPAAFALQRAVLTSGPSRSVLAATLDNYSQPHLKARYDAVLDTAQFRRVLKNPSLPVGVVRLSGSMDYQSQPNRPMLQAVRLDGEMSSRALQVRTPSFRGAITNIGARYAVANGNAEVRDLHANLLGGEVTATLTMRNITGASQSHLRASLRRVSLAELRSLVSSPALQRLALTGAANADADAAWGKTFNDLVAHVDATVQAHAAANTPGVTTSGPIPTVPLTGSVHATYAAASKRISLTNTFVRLPQTSLMLNGTVSTRSALQVRLASSDLHELENISGMFRAPSTGQPPPLGLYGTASFVGAVRGSTAAPQVTGVLQAANLRVRGSAVRVLRANVDLSPSHAILQNGVLQPACGRITFGVAVGLRRWSLTNSSPLQVNMTAAQVNIADLTRAAGVQTPLTGTLNAKIAAHGSELNPAGEGTIRLTNANLSGQPVQTLTANFQGTGEMLHANLAVQLPAAGGATATLTYFPRQQGYEAQLRAVGIQLSQLAAVKQRNLDLVGVLNLVARGRGTLRDPGIQASLQVPRLTLKGQAISGISAQANVANHVANVALNSEVVNTYVRGRGTIHLTGDYQTVASLDTQAIPLQPLVAAYAPSQGANISGQTELHASIRGPIRNMAALEAHVTIPTLAVNYRNTVHIGATNPIHLDYTNGVLALQRAAIRGTDTDLQFQGSIPVTNTAAPLSLLLLGTVDLKLAQLFNPDISSSGQVRFNINSFGAAANPNVQGEVRIVNANLASGTVPIGLSNANGVLTLTKDRLNITQFTGSVGGGTLTASGGVVYKPALRFDLDIQGRGMRFLYPQGVREAVDTDLSLAGTAQASLVRGQVRIDQLQFTPDFDLTNLTGQFSGETTPPPSGGMMQNMRLDVTIQSAGGINAVSRTMSLRAAANLTLQGTAAQPVVIGRVTVNGGDMIFMGNRYELQSGTVDFVNPARTEPMVNLAVNTTIQQYDIHMRFEGTVDHLRANYTSDPALPPSDIISLLAFGKTSEASAANPTPGNLAAESTIASGVSSLATSRIQKVAGISQLSIDPVLGGQAQGQNPGARITIQQRVTSNLFVTFATDVTSTQRDVIELQYKVTPRVTVSGTRDQNGGFGFDARIRKTW